jgi:hypothetical protein
MSGQYRTAMIQEPWNNGVFRYNEDLGIFT